MAIKNQLIGQGRDRGVPAIDTDPYAIETLLNPHTFYEELRDAGPVVWLNAHQVYAVGRHDEASVVLTDFARFTACGGVGVYDIRKSDQHRPPNPILERDPPEHSVVRKVVMQIISPSVVRSWRERFQHEADAVVERALGDQATASFDGVQDICEAFVMKAFASVLGLEMRREASLAVSEMSFNQAGPMNALRVASDARALPYLDWYRESVKRSAMRPGSVGAQLHEAEDRGELPAGVAEGACRVLVRAGTDTTIAGIGFTLQQLSLDPAQLRYVKQDLNRVKDAFEEALRLESPSYTNFRTTTAATVLADAQLAADTKIGVFLGAVGRDPRKWQEPARYDVQRRTGGAHLSFGTGMHACVGQMIARLEAECILRALLGRIDTLEPDGLARFRAINQLRTLDHLPLKVARA